MDKTKETKKFLARSLCNNQGLVIGEFRGAFVTIPIVRGSKFNYQKYENLTERDLKLNPPRWGPHRPCFYFRRHHHRRRRESDRVSAPAPWRRRRRTPASETVRKRLSQARRWWSRPPSAGSPPQFPFQHWKCCSSGSRMNLRSGTPRRDLCTPPPSCSTVRLSTISERWRAASSLPFPRRWILPTSGVDSASNSVESDKTNQWADSAGNNTTDANVASEGAKLVGYELYIWPVNSIIGKFSPATLHWIIRTPIPNHILRICKWTRA